jgi:osmoprotectant transport system substrate-binding protein
VPLRAHRPHLLRAVGATVVLAGVAAACSSGSTSTTTISALPQKVIVSSVAGDQMSTLLAALYAEALLNAGLRVERRDPYPDWPSAYAALQSNTVQVVPDFSGDLLAYLHSIGATPSTTTVPPSTVEPTTTIELPPGVTDAPTTTIELPVGDPKTVEDQVAVVKSLLPATLQVSNGSSAEHKQAIACSKAATDASTLGTYTDLGPVAAKLTLGGPAGFETSTPMGLASLTATYGATFKAFVALTPDKVDAAVKAGTVDCAVVDSTDAVITGESMTVLLDDKALVPPNGALAVMSTPGATSEVVTAVNAIDTKLTLSVVDGMTDQIVNKAQSPEYLASLFLQSS